MEAGLSASKYMDAARWMRAPQRKFGLSQPRTRHHDTVIHVTFVHLRVSTFLDVIGNLITKGGRYRSTDSVVLQVNTFYTAEPSKYRLLGRFGYV